MLEPCGVGIAGIEAACEILRGEVEDYDRYLRGEEEEEYVQ